MRVGALLPPDAALKPSGPEDKPKDVETKTVEDPNAPFAEQSRPGPKKPVDDVSSPKPEELREPTGKIEGAVVESQSTISEAEVRAAVLERRASFRRCYDLGAAAAPGFSGSVKVRVSVSPAGNVANVSLISSTTKNQQVDACVTEEVERLMFPSNGGGAVIAFPIEFGG